MAPRLVFVLLLHERPEGLALKARTKANDLGLKLKASCLSYLEFISISAVQLQSGVAYGLTCSDRVWRVR